MFGPNGRATIAPTFANNYHHRSVRYSALLSSTIERFKFLFDVPADSDVLFLTGSGTLANEAVLASLKYPAFIWDGEREFASRLRRLLVNYAGESILGAYSPVRVRVAYETADARYMGVGDAQFLDMVSAFPYYRPDPKTLIWTTVSSKQLGAAPVCSLVVVRPEAWETLLRDGSDYSYLNLRRYKEALAKGQSPHTPAIALLDDLHTTLRGFDPVEQRRIIDARRALVTSALPPDSYYGEGPVLVLKAGAVSQRLIQHFDLYPGMNGRQLFLYSGTDSDYDRFVRAIKDGW